MDGPRIVFDPSRLPLLGRFLATNSRLESGARGKAWHRTGGDLEFLARLGIAADSGSALGRLESAKAYQRDGITLGHSFHDRANNGGKRLRGGSLAEVGFLGSDFDEFGLVHGVIFFMAMGGHAFL